MYIHTFKTISNDSEISKMGRWVVYHIELNSLFMESIILNIHSIQQRTYIYIIIFTYILICKWVHVLIHNINKIKIKFRTHQKRCKYLLA